MQGLNRQVLDFLLCTIFRDQDFFFLDLLKYTCTWLKILHSCCNQCVTGAGELKQERRNELKNIQYEFKTKCKNSI